MLLVGKGNLDELKPKFGEDLKHRYEDRKRQLLLNTALSPSKDSFTTLKEVKQHLMDNV